MTLPGEGIAFTVESHPTREAWLEARRTAITGSDAAALWTDEIAERGGRGISPLAVFARKIVGEDGTDALNLEMGRALEPLIRAHYERETGRAITYPGPFVLLRSLPHPHLAVSLDGADLGFPDGKAAWEAKAWTGGASKWLDGIPLDVEAQTRHAMIVTGWPVAVVAAIIVGRWTVRYVPRDLDFDRLHLERAAELWNRIEARTEPDATGNDLHAIAQLHPEDFPSAVALDDRALTWARTLETAKEEAKLLDATINLARARLAQAIGDAERGVLPDGTVYTYKQQRRAGYVVEPTAFRVLRKKGERT